MNGILLMLCADVAFAVMAAAMKFTGGRLPAPEVVFVRGVVSSFALWLFFVRKRRSLIPKEPALLWGRGLVGYIALQCYFWSIPQVTLGTAVMLNYTAPIFAVLLSCWVLREKPSWVVGLSLVVSLAGVYLVTSPELAGKHLPLMAALASGVLGGFVHVMIRQSNRSDTPELIVFYFALCCVIGSGLLLLGTGWAAPSGSEWAGLLIVTLTSLCGQLFLTYSLQKAPVWVVSPFGYLTPVLGLMLGSLFWNETPSPAGLAGSALIIVCGTMMLTFFQRLRDRP